jgi:hypothetical protein
MDTMVRWILAGVLSIACVGTAIAAPSPYATGSLKQTQYTIPNDSGKLYLTVVGSESDPKYKEVKQALASDQTLAQFASVYHQKAMGTSSTMFVERYSGDYRDYPTVRVQRADGSIVSEVSGANIPPTDQLVSDLKAQCLPRNRKQTTPTVQPAIPPQATPLTPAKPRAPHISFRVALAIFCGGLGLAMVEQFHRITSGR